MTELNSILGNSVEKYQYLINNIADTIIEIDLSGIFTYISPQVQKIFGYKPKEIIGVEFFNYIHPDDMPSILETLEKAIRSEETVSLEYRVRHKEGHYVYVSANASLVKVDDNIKIVGVLKDISEKKLAEQKLKESEETFKRIINQSFMGIVILQDLSIKYVNDTVLKILGYSVDEMIKWSVTDFLNAIHPNDRTIAKERLEQRQEGLRNETRNTYKVLTKAGDLRWIDIYAKQIYYQGRESTLATLMDVTDREKGVQKVKESEEKYRELFNNMSSGVAVYEAINDGEDFIFKDFNLAGETIDKVRREDLIDKKVSEIFPGVKEFGLFDIFQKVWRTGNSESHPMKLYKDNRIEGWRENYVYKLPSGEIIAVYRDVTESEKAKQKLKESEQKFKLLYENAPLPYQSLDANGNIIDVNKAWLNFFGYKKEEVLGRWLGEFMDPSCREFLKTRFPQFKEEGEVQEVQYEVITKEGSHKIISFNGRVGYDENGNFERTHCIFKDMTERLKIERKTKESEQKLREINQLKSELLERTSHELKTPLISVK
ncbi:MAG: PAS domain S-box protein, partial [Promethearchaeota archaeon]